MVDSLIQTSAVALSAGGVTGGITVAALRVHVRYLREGLQRESKRVDALDQRLDETRDMLLQRNKP